MRYQKAPQFLTAEIASTVTLLERSVVSLEARFATRALRGSAGYRSNLTMSILQAATKAYITVLNESIGAEVDTTRVEKDAVPEVEVFVGLLVVLFLSDSKHYSKGISICEDLLERCKVLNRRTLDPIVARLYFFYSHFHDSNQTTGQIQGFILGSYRTATLRQDNDTQATLLNIMLKNYLALNLIDQADKLVSKSVFPESVGNNQLARYMYYLARIKAIQLNYSEAYSNVLQAIRKAPQTPTTAGFQQAAHKLAIIVQLLMGEIPERSLFRQENIRAALVPYLRIAQGDLAKFQETLAAHSDVFHADKNITLILRLRHNVIKAGVRRISLSYSRISLKDICLKLQLDSEEDAEYIVSKAISDGVIDATIDHQNGTVKSNEIVDVYSTSEPQNVFHQRISFCLNLHNDSVQALRFPTNAHKKALAKTAELLEEERLRTSKIIDSEMDEDDEF